MGVGNDHGVMSKTALCKLLMRKTGLCERDCLQTPPLVNTRKFLMLIIYAVLVQLVLPVSMTVELAATHIYVHAFKIFSAWQNFLHIQRMPKKCICIFRKEKTVLRL